MADNTEKMMSAEKYEKHITFGTTSEGTPLRVWIFGKGGDVIHFYGAFHGDEPVSAGIVHRLREYFSEHSHKKEIVGRTLLFVPEVNPDGLVLKTRVNARKVDLNRNFPTQNWDKHFKEPRYFPGLAAASEPEVQALMTLIKEYPPHRIISVHTWDPAQVNYDGSAKKLAKRMATVGKLPVTDDIGYPTPGSLGTWAGQEKGIPTITVEIPDGIVVAQAWERYRELFLEALHP